MTAPRCSPALWRHSSALRWAASWRGFPSDMDGKTSRRQLSRLHSRVSVPMHSTFGNFTLIGPPRPTHADGATSITGCGVSVRACNGGGRAFPQGGTTQQLDSLADRVMYGLAYRNFGDHEAWWSTLRLTAGSSVGVRCMKFAALGEHRLSFNRALCTRRRLPVDGKHCMDARVILGWATAFPAAHAPRHPLYRAVGHDALNTLQPKLPSSMVRAHKTGGLSAGATDAASPSIPWTIARSGTPTNNIPANGSFNWRTRIASFKFCLLRHAGLHGGGFACQPERRAGSAPATQ